MKKKLSTLSAALDTPRIRGSGDPDILGISYDSRRVQPGDLFAALEGLHTDGHRYIEAAVSQGARAVLHSQDLNRYPDIPCIRVADTRPALSVLSDLFFDKPSSALSVIGVTGTDGKSTTVWLIHQLLELLGRKSGFLSTVQVQTGNCVRSNPRRQSTPEAPEVQGLLRDMVEADKAFAVVEATSHGLSATTARLQDVRFRTGVFTNLSQEHLEFHGTVERYRSDKANLFRRLDPNSPSFAVLNRGDPNFDYFQQQSSAPVHTFGLTNAADLWASDLQSDHRGTQFVLHHGQADQEVRLNIPGLVNVENLLAALLTVGMLLHIEPGSLTAEISRLRGLKGRMEDIDEGQPYRVVVDYAHTPASFERLLGQISEQSPIVALFGSAGERDVLKRPLQGEIAAQYARVVILTDEDPRQESPVQILEDIARGCTALTRGQSLFLQPDRRKAIRLAFENARSGDTVLLLGKGHEQSIIYADGPRPWGEALVAREILRELGFGKA